LAARLELWAGPTLPTIDQIRQSAYDRWLQRGRPHGSEGDDWLAAEAELIFSLNYRTIVEYPLDAAPLLIVGNERDRYCRFCERTAGRVAFAPPVPLLAGGCSPSLAVAAICNDCREAFRDGHAARLDRFLATLANDVSRTAGGDGASSARLYSLDVFKSLVICALSIMPESELAHFVDTLEWASNPDATSDLALFEHDAKCLAYLTPFSPAARAWTSIAQRLNDDAPLPYSVFFLAARGLVMQIPIPLSSRDQDLDGRQVQLPRRSLAAGAGESFAQAQFLELQVARGRFD
jgi:hypothetical protein